MVVVFKTSCRSRHFLLRKVDKILAHATLFHEIKTVENKVHSQFAKKEAKEEIKDQRLLFQLKNHEIAYPQRKGSIFIGTWAAYNETHKRSLDSAINSLNRKFT